MDRTDLLRHINNVLIFYSSPKDFQETYNLILTECLRLIANLYFNGILSFMLSLMDG